MDENKNRNEDSQDSEDNNIQVAMEDDESCIDEEMDNHQ